MVPRKFIGKKMLKHPDFPGLLAFEKKIIETATKKRGQFSIPEFARQTRVSEAFVRSHVETLEAKGFHIFVTSNKPKKKPLIKSKKRKVKLKRIPGEKIRLRSLVKAHLMIIGHKGQSGLDAAKVRIADFLIKQLDSELVENPGDRITRARELLEKKYPKQRM